MFGFLASWARGSPSPPPPMPTPPPRRTRFSQKRQKHSYEGHLDELNWTPRFVRPRSMQHPEPISMESSWGRHMGSIDDEEAPTSFYIALYAYYHNLPQPLPPQLPRPDQSKCRATVNWNVRPGPDTESSDEDEDDMDAPEISEELLERPAYEPISKWSWTKNQPLSDATVLRHLHVDATCTTSFMKGTIDGTELTYICKSWSRASRPLWRGFYSELKLYSSPVYLRNLQDRFVPSLINIYESPSSISFLMDLPHTSFWMEASADMPNVLKKAVIEVYLILHNRGILHGEPELRNMLIGGDGRVTLVNFHAARAREDIPELGLERADKRDFALELRQVMYKLDYAGARARENAKMKRYLALAKRNEHKRAIHDREEAPMMEDVVEPPPAPEVWKRQWTNTPDAAPRRHVVPGQAPDELERCIDSFRHTIRVLEELDAQDMMAPLLRYPAHSSASNSSTSPTPQNPRKRKATRAADGSELPYKRARGDEETEETTPPPPTYERSTVTYDTGTSHTLLQAARTHAVKPQVDHARDFAYEPYDGPRGYYVPHPPTEALGNTMRVVHIRNANALACGEQGLPYYRLDRLRLLPPAFKRSVPQGMHIALGALKRQRAAAEEPGTPDKWRQAKRQRFEEDRAAALAEDRAVRFDDEVSYRDPPREAEYRRGFVSRPPVGSSSQSIGDTDTPLRSILKYGPPVKTMSYDLSLWPSRAQEIAEESGEASAPTDLLVPDSRPEGAAGPSSRQDALGEPGHPLPFTGVAGERAGRATGRIDTVIGDGADDAALSEPPCGPSLALTDDDLAAPAPWSVPFTEMAAGSSLNRGTDASALARDFRSMPQSGGGVGSWSGHAPSSPERDLEEEMEVEAMLLS